MEKRSSATLVFITPLLLLAVPACNIGFLGGGEFIGEGDLKISAGYSINADSSIRFSITIGNYGSTEAKQVFTSSQIYELEVSDDSGNVVWNFSHNRVFAQVITELRLAPGQFQTDAVNWDRKRNDGQRLPHGVYDAKVFLVAGSHPKYEFKLRI